MKSPALCLLFVSSFAIAAQQTPIAPSNNMSSMTMGNRLTPDDPSKVAKGLRTSLLVPNYEIRVDLTIPKKNGTAQSGSEGLGLFVGYADIPTHDFGFIGGATWSKTVVTREIFQVVRLESNMTYGLHKQVFAKWGAHVHKFVETPIDLGSNFGLQAGLGFQVNRTLGAEFTAVYMKQSGGEKGVAYDAKTTGFELGVTGTF